MTKNKARQLIHLRLRWIKERSEKLAATAESALEDLKVAEEAADPAVEDYRLKARDAVGACRAYLSKLRRVLIKVGIERRKLKGRSTEHDR